MTDFEAVIGLEVHVQLATQTKIFCGATHAFGREPNTQVDPVSLGLPGSLPVINEQAVELAVRAALALGCTVHEHSKFDRKHYFYPDLPKGYQISQYDEPYCTGGGIEVTLSDGTKKFIALTRIHMEEDAGKLVHMDGGSEVDLNRAGTPLCEIVSEPDMCSAEEAYVYLVELKRALKYAGVSDCEMQEGSLRCDANVSIRPVGQTELGTKVEIKNLNSFRAVEGAIQHEIEQQIALYRAGRYDSEVVQCTKLWNPDKKITEVMRGKEGAADYRYFPDPDLPPLHIPVERVEEIRSALPELPQVREKRFIEKLGIKPDAAAILTADKEYADYFEALLAKGISAKLATNWTREEALRLASAKGSSLAEAAPIEKMAELIQLVADDKVARVVAKEFSDELFASDESATAFFEARGKIQEQDDDALSAWVAEAIAANPAVADDIKSGNVKAAGRLIGVVMKASGGKANPKSVQPEILKQLGVG